MHELREDIWMPSTTAELPDFSKAKELFLDIETIRVFDHKKHGGMYPWKGDKICGIAATVDNDPRAVYVPIRHTGPSGDRYNLPLDNVLRWLKDCITGCEEWINHNIIFDAMLCAVGDGIEFDCRLIDTLTLSKVHDSDRMGHSLKDLCRDWLGYDTSSEDQLKMLLKEMKTKSYADIPVDKLGVYASDDVLMNRKLYRYLQEYRPTELAATWETEALLTPILFDMEFQGLKFDPQECKVQSYQCLTKMINSSTVIEEIAEREFTNSTQCIFDILINQFDLPVLMTKKEKKGGRMVDTGRPTFDKYALAMYQIHPLVASDSKLVELIDAILEYRTESQHKSLFLDSFLLLGDDNSLIHPSYTQVVRTGRMSCSRPNAQQQNERSKALIHPKDGYGFISCDYSQIEFRLIGHYIQDQQIIDAYRKDITTDFHQWVADLLHVKRKAGKTLNFGMAYGAGEPKVTKELSGNPDIIAEVSLAVRGLVENGTIDRSQMKQTFERLCQEHASKCYRAYHEKIPGIKNTAKRAASVCKQRGYVFNAYGRRRHLPERASYKAFNTIIQGCAMDIMKEGMIKLSPRYNKKSRDIGLRLAANVHDDCTSEVPLEVLNDPSVHKFIRDILENPSIKFRVPILTGLGISSKNWAEASGDNSTIRLADGSVVVREITKIEPMGPDEFVVSGKII